MDAHDPPQITTVEPASAPAGDADARRRWIDLGLVLLLSVFPSTFGAAHEMLYPSGSADGWTNYRFFGGLLHQASCLLLLLYVLARQKRPLRSIGLGFRWSDPFTALGLVMVAVVLVLTLTTVVKGATPFFLGHPADIRRFPMSTGVFSLFILAYSISSPIYEEVMVRGYLMTELIGLGKPIWLATIASIVVQTSYHVYYGFAGGIAISGVFIAFSLYFALSRRLLPVILAHMYWDVGLFFLKHH